MNLPKRKSRGKKSPIQAEPAPAPPHKFAPRVYELAATQGGLILSSDIQAMAPKISNGQIEQMGWHFLEGFEGVVSVARRNPHPAQPIWAAILAEGVGDEVKNGELIVSHLTAADIWGCDEITESRRFHVVRNEISIEENAPIVELGSRLFVHSSVHRVDAINVYGMWVTSPEQTLSDLAEMRKGTRSPKLEHADQRLAQRLVDITKGGVKVDNKFAEAKVQIDIDEITTALDRMPESQGRGTLARILSDGRSDLGLIDPDRVTA